MRDVSGMARGFIGGEGNMLKHRFLEAENIDPSER